MAEKVTVMKLKVDLQCEKCYKKVKKLLCKFPQIRDQQYDEKHNIVTITVVCCSPEKIRDKLCCKGGGSIKSIEIVEPPKPKPQEKQKEPEKPKETAKPKETEKPKEQEKPKESEKHKEKPPPGPPPERKCEPPPPKPPPERKCEPPPPKPPPECKCKPPPPKPPPECKCEPPPPKPPPEVPVPVCHPAPPPLMIPIGVCCVPCYEGRAGGPCFHGYGGPPPCYDGCYGRPVYDSYGGGRPCYVSRCAEYLCEDNTSGCTIM